MIMHRKLVALFLFVTVFVACSPSWRKPPVSLANLDRSSTVYICLDLPDAQQKAASDAVEMWDKAIGNWKHLVATKSHDDTFCGLWVHETTAMHSKDPTALAWASAIGGREIFMKVGRYEKDTKGILMHELGHALGAQHVVGSLMNATWAPGTFLCPDIQAVGQVAAFHDVDIETLSWCRP
jgi:hypothetical protein